MRNAALKYVCRTVGLTVEAADTLFTDHYRRGQHIRLPVAHHDGNYFADPETLVRLKGDDRVAFRYTEEVNGSADQIAGIVSENRRILGMMPHPERASEPALGNTDGKALFTAITESLVSN
jgi:phosphoribosylformylglycinamidine synthase